MNPVEKVLEAVDDYEARASGFWCLCPAHDDHDPSLHVEEAEDGSALFKCRAGCDQADVLAALETRGLKKRDLFPKASLPNETSSMNGHSKDARRASSGRGHLAASYHVKDASGCLVAVHERWEGSSGKRFLWRHPNGGYSKRARSGRQHFGSTAPRRSQTGRRTTRSFSSRARSRSMPCVVLGSAVPLGQ
jgi:hypothetical protein